MGRKAKLYRFDREGNQWKERGVETVKLLKHKATGKVRLCHEAVQDSQDMRKSSWYAFCVYIQLISLTLCLLVLEFVCALGSF